MKLPGIGEKKIEWVDTKDDLSVRQLVSDIRNGDINQLRNNYNMTTAVAETLTKLAKEQVFELEEIVLSETLDIMLNVGTREELNFKDISNLSSGQKCTAILNLLLLESKDPLIIDQPEDNLDNAFIAENIVSELRNQKETRQFIFSTHNANIPVFGDAEWIGVMEIDQGSAIIKDEYIGSIDNPNLKPMVEMILEGGKQAFEMRRLKYNF
jgi:ABC-type dipeptide/oligopeptide/nickel transport system ATPase subunit